MIGLSPTLPAEKIYDSIRNSTTDVAAISNNTGLSEATVARIKDHVFVKEHTFQDGRTERFGADPEIANAWSRLETGDFTQKDIDLLNHEIRESRVEGIFDVDYRRAHDAVEKKGWVWKPEE